MKKIAFLLVIIFFHPLDAQTFSEASWVAKFGMAAGFTPAYTFPNFDPINEKIENLGLGNLSAKGLITYGGGAYAYITFIENLRVGGTGFSGSTSVAGVVGGENRKVEYSIGGGAVTIEYTIPKIKNIALSFGLMIGGGSADIEIYSKTSSLDWNSIWLINDETRSNYYKKITNSFYYIAPTINLDIPINRFVAFRLGGGYQLTFANDWTYDNNESLPATPDNMNSNMFFIQTGIFVGFFAF